MEPILVRKLTPQILIKKSQIPAYRICYLPGINNQKYRASLAS
jgi:hypothetical protein